jgi:hypothetical protein
MSHFHPSIILADKAGAYLSGLPYKCRLITVHKKLDKGEGE